MTTINANRTNTKKPPRKKAAPPSQPLRRTPRIRLSKNQNGQPSLIDLEAHEFLDIPLQYAEGRDILTAIGASSIPIPPNLLAAAPKQPPDAIADQVQISKPKKAKRATCSAQSMHTPTGPSNTSAGPSHTPVGPLDPTVGPPVLNTASIRPCAAQQSATPHGIPDLTNTAEATPTHSPSDNDAPQLEASVPPSTDLASNAEDDDPYLDRVDYSDEEDPAC